MLILTLHYFKAKNSGITAIAARPESHIYGEALAFFKVRADNQDMFLLAYKSLESVHQELCTLRGIWNAQNQTKIIKVEDVIELIGIWESDCSNWVYILQKHPGFELLKPEEKGQADDEAQDDLNSL